MVLNSNVVNYSWSTGNLSHRAQGEPFQKITPETSDNFLGVEGGVSSGSTSEIDDSFSKVDDELLLSLPGEIVAAYAKKIAELGTYVTEQNQHIIERDALIFEYKRAITLRHSLMTEVKEYLEILNTEVAAKDDLLAKNRGQEAELEDLLEKSMMGLTTDAASSSNPSDGYDYSHSENTIHSTPPVSSGQAHDESDIERLPLPDQATKTETIYADTFFTDLEAIEALFLSKDERIKQREESIKQWSKALENRDEKIEQDQKGLKDLREGLNTAIDKVEKLQVENKSLKEDKTNLTNDVIALQAFKDGIERKKEAQRAFFREAQGALQAAKARREDLASFSAEDSSEER